MNVQLMTSPQLMSTGADVIGVGDRVGWEMC
jgi:hypothetical protein